MRDKVLNIKDDLTYYLGTHKIMGGLAYEYKMADNAYMRNGMGYYRYRSLDDFLNGATPEIVALTYGYNGNENPTAKVAYNKAGIYAQDQWSISPRFDLTYGFRLDGLFFDDSDIMTNNAILALDYNGRHVDTGKWPGNSLQFSPRVGFSWDVLGDKSLKVRGGTGLFTGDIPLVFFTNMPTNSGMIQQQAVANAKNLKKNFPSHTMDEFAGGLVTDANGKATLQALKDRLFSIGYPSIITPKDGTMSGNISGVDPDFKLPQVWKTSLGVDYSVPVNFPFTVSAEATFTKTIYDTVLRDWAVSGVEGFPQFNGSDNRHIYPADFKIVKESAYVLENTHKGYGWIFAAEAKAQPTDWLALTASYTHTVKKEITGMPGANAASVLNYMATVEGPNYARLHNSQYVTPNRVSASATIHDHAHNHYTLFYEGFNGGYNYSFMTSNDVNGDGYNYDAIYIPTDEQVKNGQFRFVSEDDQTRFMDFVHKNKYLKNHQGKYAEAYSLYSPWVHRFDFSYKHDFVVKVGSVKNTLQLGFDIRNVGNLFKSKWGVMKQLNPNAFAGGARVLKYEGQDADGYALWSTPSTVSKDTKTWDYNRAIGQCWYMSIGVKYIFN